jgi:hypothetical protein
MNNHLFFVGYWPKYVYTVLHNNSNDTDSMPEGVTLEISGIRVQLPVKSKKLSSPENIQGIQESLSAGGTPGPLPKHKYENTQYQTARRITKKPQIRHLHCKSRYRTDNT